MMTRKDYVVTASILDEFIGSLPIEYQDECLTLVEDFCQMFAEDNPKFLFDKFIDACYRHRS